MSYTKQEIEEWLIVRLSECSNVFKADRRQEFDRKLSRYKVDTNKLSWFIFNKYKIKITTEKLDESTIGALIDYIDDCLMWKAAIPSEDSNQMNSQSSKTYIYSSSEVIRWVKDIYVRYGGVKYSMVSYNDRLADLPCLNFNELEWNIFKKFNLQIPAKKLKMMNAGNLVDAIDLGIKPKNKQKISTKFSEITFGNKIQLKEDLYYNGEIAKEAINNIRNVQKETLKYFWLTLFNILLPLFFIGPNLIKHSVLFMSFIDWIICIPCWLGTIVGIILVVFGYRPFLRCKISFSKEKQRLFSHYVGTLIFPFVLLSYCFAYADSTIEPNTFSSLPESISNISLGESNYHAGDYLTDAKSQIENSGNSALITWSIVCAIVFNMIVCTLLRIIVRKFNKMEVDGVILGRNPQPEQMRLFWKGETKPDKEEKNKMVAIRMKTSMKLLLYYIIILVSILITTYFSIIKPCMEI